MRKRFVAKKRKKKKLKVIVLIVLFITIFSYTTIKLLNNIDIKIDDETIVDFFLNKKSQTLSFDKIITPEFLFEYTFNYKLLKNENYVFKEDVETHVEETEIVDQTPTVYIYNAHPTEEYLTTSIDVFNINPTVITASYILKEYLKTYGIYSYVEEKSAVDVLRENNWSYSYSYDAARIIMEKTYESNPQFDFFIDLHRDSSIKNITTAEINNEECARMMFVVGEEHDNYEKNKNLMISINNSLNEISDNYSRGVYLKSGVGVNGKYNQDFHENTILVEVGGQYNTIDEVNCALKYLAEILSEVIKDG